MSRTFDFEADTPTRPVWLVWDISLARGDCLRCGDALSAFDEEPSEQALRRHIFKHRECAPDYPREDY